MRTKGAPRITLEEKESTSVEKKMIALELPNSLYQQIRKEGFDKELSLSATIRHILALYFHEKEKHTEEEKESTN